MKCPDCGKRLVTLPPCKGEWLCVNDDCPTNIGQTCHNEYYGNTQAEINKMKQR